MKILKLLPILLLAFLTGCAHEPDIPGFHWRGYYLFNVKGVEVASVIGYPLDIDVAQACIFNASGLKDTGCTYWETKQQAYDHIKEAFERGK